MVEKGRRSTFWTGHNHSEDTIRKLIGRERSDEHRAAISIALRVDFSTEEKLDILDRVYDRQTISSIADLHEVSRTAISNFIKREADPSRLKKRKKPNKPFMFTAHQIGEITRMRFEDGMSNKKISGLLSLPYSPVKTLNSRTRLRMQDENSSI